MILLLENTQHKKPESKPNKDIMLTVMNYPALWQPALFSKQIQIVVCYQRQNGNCDQHKPPRHSGFIVSICAGWLEDFAEIFHLILSLCPFVCLCV